jgi:outer membrane receptor protein involved in Fe transport
VFGADGRIIPVFRPAPGGIGSGANRLEQWIPTIGAQLDLTTDSFFVHDRWAFNRNWTFDLGLRYERVRGEATGDIRRPTPTRGCRASAPASTCAATAA